MPVVEIPSTNEDEETVVNEWVRYGMRLGVNVALHPFEYAKSLIQMGYEPIAPKPGKSLLGYPTLVLPNVFTYVGFIKRTDGFIGCFRGVTPKLLGNITSSYGSEKVAERLGFGSICEDLKDESDLSDEELSNRFKKQLKKDVVLHISGVIISHPFHVISLRMMGEFIGHEGKYLGVFSSVREIVKHEGINGFFCGLVPRLLCDVSVLVLVSTSSYYFHKYVVKDIESRQYFTSISQLVFSSILYPLHVVSTCMIISRSGLAAGKPPNMPTYDGLLDCWSHLSSTNSLKRGNSLFFRYFKPISNERQAMIHFSMPKIQK